MENIIVDSLQQLREIINAHILKYGDCCDLNHIDVSNITNMDQLFYRSPFQGDISKWDVSNVTNMSFMFRNSLFNGDISKWNVSNVKDMFCIFKNSQFSGDLSKWQIHSHCYLEIAFQGSKYPSDGILYWYFAMTNKVKDMDPSRAAHMGMMRPVVEGMGLGGIRAAKYLNDTYKNTSGQDVYQVEF